MGCKWTSFKLHLRIIGYNSNRVCLECASPSVKATVFVFLFLASLKFSEVMREMFVCYSLFNLFISREDNFRKNERGCCRGRLNRTFWRTLQLCGIFPCVPVFPYKIKPMNDPVSLFHISVNHSLEISQNKTKWTKQIPH